MNHLNTYKLKAHTYIKQESQIEWRPLGIFFPSFFLILNNNNIKCHRDYNKKGRKRSG